MEAHDTLLTCKCSEMMHKVVVMALLFIIHVHKTLVECNTQHNSAHTNNFRLIGTAAGEIYSNSQVDRFEKKFITEFENISN